MRTLRTAGADDLSEIAAIRTDRLVLRPATDRDAPQLADVFLSNAGELKLCGLPRIAGTADAARYLAGELAREHGRCLALVERASGAVIGLVSLLVPNPVDGVPWINLLVVAADGQDRGIGGEAVSALESALAGGGWNAVCLSVVASNERGRRFWERLGYVEEPDAWHAYNGHRPVEIVMRHAIRGDRSSA